jgi:hypothetical protein
VFLKCPAPAAKHEVALTVALAAHCPGRIAEPIAADADAGWMLFADGGSVLRDRNQEEGFSWKRWEAFGHAAGELQLEASRHLELWFGAGCRDARLGRLPDLKLELVERYEARVGNETAKRLKALMLGPLVEPLAELGLPDSILHNDLHDLNVFAGDEGLRIFDWGDAVVGFPLMDVAVLLDSAAAQGGVSADPGQSPELARLLDAYLEPFTALAPATELRASLGGVRRLASIARALVWDGLDEILSDAERERFGDRVRFYLDALATP